MICPGLTSWLHIHMNLEHGSMLCQSQHWDCIWMMVPSALPYLYLTKTLVVETSYIAIIALVLLRECSPSLLLNYIKCMHVVCSFLIHFPQMATLLLSDCLQSPTPAHQRPEGVSSSAPHNCGGSVHDMAIWACMYRIALTRTH